MKQWFANLKINKRLLLAFSGMLVLVCITGITGIVSLQIVHPLLETTYKGCVIPLVELDRVCRNWYRIRIDVLKIASTADAAERQRLESREEEILNSISTDMARYEPTIFNEDERTEAAKYESEAKEYLRARQRIVNLANEGKLAEAQALAEGEARDKFHLLISSLDHLLLRQSQNADELFQTSESTVQSSTIGLAGVLLVSLLTGIVFSRIIGRSVSGPVVQLEQAAREIAAGNLNAAVQIHSSDELGNLAVSFNSMVGSIRSGIEEVQLKSAEAEVAAEEARTALDTITRLSADVRLVAEEVAQHTGNISASVEELAAGAEEQATQTSEVAAATEEMARTIAETTHSIAITAASATQASDAAREGTGAVQNTKNSMAKIVSVTQTTGNKIELLSSKVEEVGHITQVINEIADQTNLLALNAAIEAARAGEHGRGFAVVADEVRKLAERTGKATKDIASVLKAIQDETLGARRSMEEAADVVRHELLSTEALASAFNNISSETENVTSLINQIAVASEEQSSTMIEVSKNIEGMHIVSEQTAIGVQHIAEATSQLNDLTAHLRKLVEQFADSDTPAPATHSRRR